MKHRITHFFFFSLIFLVACSPGKKREEKAEQAERQAEQPDTNAYPGLVPSVARIESFDNGRFLESETGFFVDSNVLVCRLEPLINATGVRLTPWDETKQYHVSGFLAVDRINGLVLLKVEGISRKGIRLFPDSVAAGTKSLYLTKPQGNTLPLHRGKVNSLGTVNGAKRYLLSNLFLSQSYGSPVFIAPDKCIGLGYTEIVDYESQNMAIPAVHIAGLLRRKQATPEPLQKLRASTDRAVSDANSKIKGLIIETDMGNLKVRLFNQTPDYRDNFLSLVREHFYDSLLIHRVIKGFGIQSGAADTRYAGKDDVVGWKGPGYTLPAHIVPGFFHRRGMIGSPRKPDSKNSKRRSDGSQYYIVTGRTYNDAELNEIEQQNNYRFTPEQRRIYKTIGGAPHLDGSYTIFGEVTEGLPMADRISQVEVNSDFRPLKDIRVRKITIIR